MKNAAVEARRLQFGAGAGPSTAIVAVVAAVAVAAVAVVAVVAVTATVGAHGIGEKPLPGQQEGSRTGGGGTPFFF